MKKLIAITILVTLSIQLKAQSDQEPLYEQLQSTFQKDYLSIGGLLQVVGDFQPDRNLPGNNGFSVANFRLKISGEFDQGFGYVFQTKFDNTPAILDAKAYYEYASEFRVSAGVFKAPFSYELLTGAGAIDFVNRSQAVNFLAPARQTGVEFSGWFMDESLHYSAGLFNGNGISKNNDNNNFMYSGRLAYHGATSETSNLIVGVNAATSEDNNLAIPGLIGNFSGTRNLLGGDIRFTLDDILLSGEYIYSSFEPTNGSTINPSGYHFTAGYMLSEKSQILVRLDQFDTDINNATSEAVVLGFNLWPTGVSEVQLNYVIPTQDNLENSQLLLNFQIGF